MLATFADKWSEHTEKYIQNNVSNCELILLTRTELLPIVLWITSATVVVHVLLLECVVAESKHGIESADAHAQPLDHRCECR